VYLNAADALYFVFIQYFYGQKVSIIMKFCVCQLYDSDGGKSLVYCLLICDAV
jgi:hypothetical protein